MIEGIKKIREAFKRITSRTRKKETMGPEKEKMDELRKEMKQIKEELKDSSKKEQIFADGEQLAEVPGIIEQKERKGDGWLVYGIRGEKWPKVIEIRVCKNKADKRKQKRRLYNAGNNRRKMIGMPLRRFTAKEKVRKRVVSESDTMK